MPLTLEIVTPDAKVYTDSVDSVVIPTVEGEIGVLPGHLPLVTQVNDGELRALKGNQTQFLAVGGGFAQIDADRVRVLAEHAISEDKIDENAVAEAMRRAQEGLRAKQEMDPAEVERLEALVRFSVAQLEIKRRRK
jgi:F-type H+-transporting ATPase subunit epsilon